MCYALPNFRMPNFGLLSVPGIHAKMCDMLPHKQSSAVIPKRYQTLDVIKSIAIEFMYELSRIGLEVSIIAMAQLRLQVGLMIMSATPAWYLTEIGFKN